MTKKQSSKITILQDAIGRKYNRKLHKRLLRRGLIKIERTPLIRYSRQRMSYIRLTEKGKKMIPDTKVVPKTINNILVKDIKHDLRNFDTQNMSDRELWQIWRKL
jgi:DNA-binding MarR family transcriptional regulator